MGSLDARDHGPKGRVGAPAATAKAEKRASKKRRRFMEGVYDGGSSQSRVDNEQLRQEKNQHRRHREKCTESTEKSRAKARPLQKITSPVWEAWAGRIAWCGLCLRLL